MDSVLRKLARHPVIQAPMAGVSTPVLAAEVTNAGGLGSIAIGASSVEAARGLIEDTRARTPGAFNVNVFCHAPARRDVEVERAWLSYLTPVFDEFGANPPGELKEIYKSFVEDDDAFRLLLELRPAVVSFHFGLPAQERINALKEAGIVLLATATNLDEAREIEAAGVDAVVAQGIEAGGHRGVFDTTPRDSGLSTSVLVSLLARECRIPVIAAGGIMDASGIRAALDLGAVAAQMGTAFILCPESAADAAYREALISARAYDTRFTSAISGRMARGLANRFTKMEAAGPRVPAYPVAYDAGKALHAAARARGSNDFAAHWAGQGAPLARPVAAARLMEELVRDLERRS